jgi:hypothetical protein
LTHEARGQKADPSSIGFARVNTQKGIEGAVMDKTRDKPNRSQNKGNCFAHRPKVSKQAD